MIIPTYKKTLAQAMLNISAKLPMDDKKVVDRLNRAYDIVRNLGSGYAIKKRGDIYTIHKESTSLLEDNSVQYTIGDNGLCSCPDNPTARGNMCKHKLAVKLIEEMLVDEHSNAAKEQSNGREYDSIQR